jgi:hypothetical protein
MKDYDREIVDYYNGVVVDINSKPVDSVEVTMYVRNRDNGKKDKNKAILTTNTNDSGYFEIKDKTIDSVSIHIESRELVFKKNGYILDSAVTLRGQSSYRPLYDHYDGYYFVFKIPDTLVLKKNKQH